MLYKKFPEKAVASVGELVEKKQAELAEADAKDSKLEEDVKDKNDDGKNNSDQPDEETFALAQKLTTAAIVSLLQQTLKDSKSPELIELKARVTESDHCDKSVSTDKPQSLDVEVVE